MEAIGLLVVLVGILLIAGVSRRIRDTIITLPMLYVLFGLFVGLVIRDLIGLSLDDPLVEIIAQLTLVLVLATDASRINLKSVLSSYTLPLRLLGIGLPLTMLLGAVLAAAMFGQLGFWEAAILAVILAPTDASLGQSVVENPKVPVRIRQALNIESGLNDGFAMPFLILAISLAVSSETKVGSGYFVELAVSQIVFGVLAGVVLGYLGARYIGWGRKSGWMSGGLEKISWLALVLLAFGAAELVGGNGFIAAFVFGITSGNVISTQQMKRVDDFAEVENTLLILLTYMIFGMVMLIPALERINLTVVLYAVLSLTLVRMLPVAISLIGAKLRPVTVLFLGWFGPRGIASILYVLTVLEAEQVAGKETIYTVAMITIFMSVLAHGISAAPLADWYGKHIAAYDKRDAAGAETTPVPEMPTRRKSLKARPGSSTPANVSK
jgi:NhaP-type Na+/H+ or K+/H+ antiporter